MLGEPPINDINDNVCELEKKFSINFTKTKSK